MRCVSPALKLRPDTPPNPPPQCPCLPHPKSSGFGGGGGVGRREDYLVPQGQAQVCGVGGGGGGLHWKGQGPRRRPQRRLGRRLEAVAKAVGGVYCRLQTPLKLALGVRGTVAGHRLGALEGGGGGAGPPPPSSASLGGGDVKGGGGRRLGARNLGVSI